MSGSTDRKRGDGGKMSKNVCVVDRQDLHFVC